MFKNAPIYLPHFGIWVKSFRTPSYKFKKINKYYGISVTGIVIKKLL